MIQTTQESKEVPELYVVLFIDLNILGKVNEDAWFVFITCSC